MDTFAALADPTRRHIIEMLAQSGQLSASDISNEFPISAPAISQHLKILRQTKLVEVEKHAQQRLYTVNPQAINEIERWLQKMRQTWENRFDRLEKMLEEQKRKGK